MDPSLQHHAVGGGRPPILYIPIPKAACTAVKIALRAALGLPDRPIPLMHELDWPVLIPVSQIHPETFSFTVIRNPWDRLLSCYFDKLQNEALFYDLRRHHDVLRLQMTFGEFVEAVAEIPDEQADEHLRSQVSLLSHAGRLLPNLILRFEQLSQDWQMLREFCPMLPPLKVYNSSQHPAYCSEIYSPRLRTLVAHRYECDRDIFGYAFV